MRTSQVRRFLLCFSLLALIAVPCLSTNAPVASADPTWVPVFDDCIVATVNLGNGRLRVVHAAKGAALEAMTGQSASYGRLDMALSNLWGISSVRIDGGYVAGANSQALLGLEGLTDEADSPSDLNGVSTARTYD